MRVLDLRKSISGITVVSCDGQSVAILLHGDDHTEEADLYRRYEALWGPAVWQYWPLVPGDRISEVAVGGFRIGPTRLSAPCVALRTTASTMFVSGPFIPSDRRHFHSFIPLVERPGTEASLICINEQNLSDNQLRLGVTYQMSRERTTANRLVGSMSSHS